MSEHTYVVQRKFWHELNTLQLLQVVELILTHDHQNADLSVYVTFPEVACFLVTISKLSPL